MPNFDFAALVQAMKDFGAFLRKRPLIGGVSVDLAVGAFVPSLLAGLAVLVVLAVSFVIVAWWRTVHEMLYRAMPAQEARRELRRFPVRVTIISLLTMDFVAIMYSIAVLLLVSVHPFGPVPREAFGIGLVPVLASIVGVLYLRVKAYTSWRLPPASSCSPELRQAVSIVKAMTGIPDEYSVPGTPFSLLPLIGHVFIIALIAVAYISPSLG